MAKPILASQRAIIAAWMTANTDLAVCVLSTGITGHRTLPDYGGFTIRIHNDRSVERFVNRTYRGLRRRVTTPGTDFRGPGWRDRLCAEVARLRAEVDVV